uniref:BBSome-interacting protein 1 n=1 Tax=Megaselia scalaris TaxID=36166 RepID=T1H7K6_MEGSC
KMDLILPTTGKLFFETKTDLKFCQPQLMQLKSFTLEKLEIMQKEAHKQLQEN